MRAPVHMDVGRGASSAVATVCEGSSAAEVDATPPEGWELRCGWVPASDQFGVMVTDGDPPVRLVPLVLVLRWIESLPGAEKTKAEAFDHFLSCLPVQVMHHLFELDPTRMNRPRQIDPLSGFGYLTEKQLQQRKVKAMWAGAFAARRNARHRWGGISLQVHGVSAMPSAVKLTEAGRPALLKRLQAEWSSGSATSGTLARLAVPVGVAFAAWGWGMDVAQPVSPRPRDVDGLAACRRSCTKVAPSGKSVAPPWDEWQREIVRAAIAAGEKTGALAGRLGISRQALEAMLRRESKRSKKKPVRPTPTPFSGLGQRNG